MKICFVVPDLPILEKIQILMKALSQQMVDF